MPDFIVRKMQLVLEEVRHDGGPAPELPRKLGAVLASLDLIALQLQSPKSGQYITSIYGADALQIFDSWGGALSARDYTEFVQPRMLRLIAALKDCGVPIISYVNGCRHLLDFMCESGADVVAIDWRVEAKDAVRIVDGRCAIQGNMDPCALLATPEAAVRETEKTLREFDGVNGYIFNLGSGILKWTPVPAAKACVETVRNWRK